MKCSRLFFLGGGGLKALFSLVFLSLFLFAGYANAADANLKGGGIVNAAIKRLVNPSAVSSTKDETIEHFKRADSLPSDPSIALVDIALAGGEPVNIWRDSSDATVYYHTEADQIYLNPNSSVLFLNFSGMKSIDTSGWNTSKVTNMQAMFESCTNLVEIDVSERDTSKVTNMINMFIRCSNLAELNVSNWDTSSVKNMTSMFHACRNLTELDVKDWNTSNVTIMASMFRTCKSLTGLDVSNWDISKVTNMSYMFEGCSKLETLDVSKWEPVSVANFSYMFANCSSLKELNVNSWDTEKATNMASMFSNSYGLTELDVKDWNTSNVTTMASMFENCTGFTQLDVSGWNTEKVTAMNRMFYGCKNLETISGLETWDTSKVTNMGAMFYTCTNLKNLDNIQDWQTDSVTNMSSMFGGCSSLTGLYLNNWNTSSLKDASYMFTNCTKLEILEVSERDTSSLTNMSTTFNNCTSLTELDLHKRDVSNVTSMYNLFQQSRNLKKLDVSGRDTSNVTSMHRVFCQVGEITELDLTSRDTSNVMNMRAMFAGNKKLKTIYASDKFKMDQMTTTNLYDGIFGWGMPELVGGNGTKVSATTTYGYVDRLSPLQTGYFTDPNAFTVRFMSKGVDVGTQTIARGDTATEISGISPEGYDFDGRYDDKLTAEFDFTQELHRYTEIHAKLIPHVYSIVFDSNGGAGTVASISAEYDKEYTIPTNTFTKAGHVFSGRNTQPDGSGTGYKARDKVKNLTTNSGDVITIYATWTPQQYTVSFNSNGGGTVPSQKISYGDKVDKSAISVSKDGYSLGGWYRNSALTQPFDLDNDVVTGNLTLYAKWNPNICKVTYDNQGANESGTQFSWYRYKTPTNGVYFWLNEELTIPMVNYKITLPKKIGYTFGGYYNGTGGVGTQYVNYQGQHINNLLNVYTGDVTIYAKRTPRTDTPYTIEHIYKGTSDGIPQQIVEVRRTGTTDSTVTGAIVHKNGFNDPLEQTVQIKPDGTAKLTYEYEREEYELKYDSDGGTDVSSINVVFEGLNPKTPTTSKTGYIFERWEGSDRMPIGGTTLKAKWTPRTDTPYTVKHFKQNIDGTYNSIPTDIDNLVGTTDTKIAPNRKNYVGFTAPSGEELLIKPDGSAELSYNYTRNSYRLIIKDGETKLVDEDVKFEDNIILPASPTKSGYTFSGWKNVPLDGKMPATPLEITAQWTANSYSITFDTDGGSSITVLTGDYGSAITAPSDPTKTGYTFSGWNPVFPSTMPLDGATLKAEWTVNSYSITFDTDGGSSIPVLTGDYGSMITPPANPTRNGYTFKGWEPALPSTIPAENITVKAIWEQNKNGQSGGGGMNIVKDKEGKNDNSDNLDNGYSQEFIDAYNFAFQNGITTMPTIDQADMTGNLTRIQMAKMLSYYAINIMGKKPDETRNNKFNDVSEKLNSDYNSGVTLAYQLGIMGINMPNNNFRPNDLVTRGEFVTALSRMVYGTQDGEYEKTDIYYTNHMNKLKSENIVTTINPTMKELRAYVMIMLKRTSEK